jgi:hypothetical protein
MGWKLDDMAKRYIEKVIRHTLKDGIGAEWMVPPSHSKPALIA